MLKRYRDIGLAAVIILPIVVGVYWLWPPRQPVAQYVYPDYKESEQEISPAGCDAQSLKKFRAGPARIEHQEKCAEAERTEKWNRKTFAQSLHEADMAQEITILTERQNLTNILSVFLLYVTGWATALAAWFAGDAARAAKDAVELAKLDNRPWVKIVQNRNNYPHALLTKDDSFTINYSIENVGSGPALGLRTAVRLIDKPSGENGVDVLNEIKSLLKADASFVLFPDDKMDLVDGTRDEPRLWTENKVNFGVLIVVIYRASGQVNDCCTPAYFSVGRGKTKISGEDGVFEVNLGATHEEGIHPT
jgi:hypothetical protein